MIEFKHGIDQIKIVSFGTSRFHDTKKLMKEQFGYLHYKAPEVFKGKYDASVDIWAVGIMFYQMFTGEHPFIGKTDEETIARILKCEPDMRQFAFHETSKDFCAKMLQPKRKHRATAQELLEHKLLSETKEIEIESSVKQEAMKNLMDYHKKTTLQQTVLTYMVSQYTEKSMKDKVGKLFKEFDRNGDGRLDRSEIEQGYHHFNKHIDGDTLDEMMR